jgi:SAM-dependent methyltransferase
VHRQTIDAYDAAADRWLATRYREDRPPLDAALAFRARVGTDMILDLGCGPGELLGDLGQPCIGLDASRGMLDLALGRGAGPLAQGDAEQLPLADESIGGVFANFSLQHLPREGFQVAIREVLRVLRPGGHVEITMHRSGGVDGVRADDDIPIGRWFTYWEAGDVAAELTDAGFTEIAGRDLGFANQFRARRPGVQASW